MYIYFVLILVLFSSCSSLDVSKSWSASKQIAFYVDKFKVGDILIKNKKISNPLSWFGHSAVVVNSSKVAEFPKVGKNYVETPLLIWLFDERDIIILRYEYFDEVFKKKFFENLDTIKTKKYALFSSVENSDSFYCSKFIYFLFYKTSNELGYEFEIPPHLFFITPYDLLKTKSFKKVNFLETKN